MNKNVVAQDDYILIRRSDLEGWQETLKRSNRVLLKSSKPEERELYGAVNDNVAAITTIGQLLYPLPHERVDTSVNTEKDIVVQTSSVEIKISIKTS